MRDLYSVLGVSRSASADEIKKAYRKLTRELHPDKNPGDKKAEDRYKEVTQAYEVLGDEQRRKDYDDFGEMSLTVGFDRDRARAYKQAQQQSAYGGFGGHSGAGDGASFFSDLGDAQATSFDDLLSKLFGGGRVNTGAQDIFGGRARGPSQVRGRDIEGEVSVSFMDALLGTTVPLRIDGGGKAARTLDVKVPPGASDRAKLRLRGQGGAGSPAGDILLTVRVKPSKSLSRDGDNLRMSVPVSALEAYRGGPIDVPTPWGDITLKLPAGCQNGQTLRVRGKGVRKGKKQGDLFVTLDLRLPPAGDEALLEALERLQGKEQVRDNFELA